jgi:hypothetical protein
MTKTSCGIEVCVTMKKPTFRVRKPIIRSRRRLVRVLLGGGTSLAVFLIQDSVLCLVMCLCALSLFRILRPHFLPFLDFFGLVGFGVKLD